MSVVLCLLLFIPATVLSIPAGHGARKAVVCYVGTWAAYRPGRGAFSIEDLRPDLCTHIVYSFAGLNATSWTLRSLDPHLDLEDNYGKGWYKKTTGLKKQQPGLKVTLAVGGWNEGSANYSALAADPSKRKLFIDSVLHFIKEYDFDGLDLDWEFPTQRGGAPEDKANFVTLIKELKSVLTVGGYILTAAISASVDTLRAGYDLPAISASLDLVHVMAYDYHGNWDKTTAPNAPLLPASDKLTFSASVQYLLDAGVPAEKLILGVPMYGRTFILKTDSAAPRFGEEAIPDQGFQGPFTRTNGFLGYNEICNELKTGNWSVHWDNASLTPFAINGNKFITYDDEASIVHKVRHLPLDIGGVMTWSVDTDDFRGDCSPTGSPFTSHPLLRAIVASLQTTTAGPGRGGTTTPVAPSVATSHLPSSVWFSAIPFLILSSIY